MGPTGSDHSSPFVRIMIAGLSGAGSGLFAFGELDKNGRPYRWTSRPEGGCLLCRVADIWHSIDDAPLIGGFTFGRYAAMHSWSIPQKGSVEVLIERCEDIPERENRATE